MIFGLFKKKEAAPSGAYDMEMLEMQLDQARHTANNYKERAKKWKETSAELVEIIIRSGQMNRLLTHPSPEIRSLANVSQLRRKGLEAEDVEI